MTTKYKRSHKRRFFLLNVFLDKEMNLDTKGVWVVTYVYSDR